MADPVSKDELNELGRDVTAQLIAAGQKEAEPETLRKAYGALLKRYDDFKAAGVKPYVSMDQASGSQNATDFGNLGYIIRDLNKKITTLEVVPKVEAESSADREARLQAAMEETQQANLANIQAETERLKARTEDSLAKLEADIAAQAAQSAQEAEIEQGNGDTRSGLDTYHIYALKPGMGMPAPFTLRDIFNAKRDDVPLWNGMDAHTQAHIEVSSIPFRNESQEKFKQYSDQAA
ncbi:MAG TPA: hypothetical protein PLO23_11805, partial [Alphaproteobacteria bacterium]|nr:hypothetical protein [Alphaproteobacteria bacterium]